MPFKSLGLSDQLVQGILATGYTAPTAIQSQAIPSAVEGRDIIGCAQTGTGKTAAFVLPILHRLGRESKTQKKMIRSLILTPTRELAVQIERSIIDYGRFMHLKTLAVYGGVSIQNQFSALRRGVDIVIATPGRLLDHLQRGSIDLKNVEVLVLDEADRMFDMGFINDVRKIIKEIPANRQTLLFSATMSSEVKALTAGIQKNPKLIEIGERHNPIETITQHIYPVRKDQKMDLLRHLLSNGQLYSVLVFSRTRHGADKINKHLERSGIRSISIHSGRTQGQRQRALDGFRENKYQVMVATDIAARGIDVEGISHVINFDVPMFAEDYVHRIGRTGRANATGDAITFVSDDEKTYLRRIEKFIGRKFKFEACPEFVVQKPQAKVRHSDEPGHETHSYKSEKHAPKREKSRSDRQDSRHEKAQPRHDRQNSAQHDNSHSKQNNSAFGQSKQGPKKSFGFGKKSKSFGFKHKNKNNRFRKP